jgi:hypothetical protein
VNADSAGPTGNWTHSYEEDGADVQVYRPTHAFAFPPGRRGRETLEFGAAGQVVSGMPGPDDRQVMTGAVLTCLGMNRYRLDGGQSPGQVVEIVQSEPGMLKIRRH